MFIKDIEKGAEAVFAEIKANSDGVIEIESVLKEPLEMRKLVELIYGSGRHIDLLVGLRRLSAKSKEDLLLRDILSDNCVKCRWPKI